MATQVCATDPALVLEDITAPRRESAITAWVNVIYGCNEKCSYCVVPFTRCAARAGRTVAEAPSGSTFNSVVLGGRRRAARLARLNLVPNVPSRGSVAALLLLVNF